MADITPEQEALAVEVRNDWLKKAFYGEPVIDESRAFVAAKEIYKGSSLKEPQHFILAPSPAAAQAIANKLCDTKDEVYPLGWIGTLGGDAPFLAWADFWLREGTLKPFEELDYLLDLANSGVFAAIWLDDAFIAIPRPTELHFDADIFQEIGRLHSTKGPAIKWLDGTKRYFLHGMRVEESWVENPESITAKQVLGQQNVELRRAMITLMGMDRFVKEANATVLDSDHDSSNMPRRLLSIPMPEDETIVLVEVKCPSTGKIAHLRVPPDTTTCAAAVAWTFAEPEENYRPMVEA